MSIPTEQVSGSKHNSATRFSEVDLLAARVQTLAYQHQHHAQLVSIHIVYDSMCEFSIAGEMSCGYQSGYDAYGRPLQRPPQGPPPGADLHGFGPG